MRFKTGFCTLIMHTANIILYKHRFESIVHLACQTVTADADHVLSLFFHVLWMLHCGFMFGYTLSFLLTLYISCFANIVGTF